MRPLERPAVQLGVDVDQPAAVDHVIGRVQNALGFELIAVALLGQHVVRRARHDLDLELRDGFVVDGGAQRARRENVGLLAVDRIRRHRSRLELLHHALYARGVDVGHDQLRPFLREELGQVVPDVAGALHGDGLARE